MMKTFQIFCRLRIQLDRPAKINLMKILNPFNYKSFSLCLSNESVNFGVTSFAVNDNLIIPAFFRTITFLYALLKLQQRIQKSYQ